MFTVSLQSRLAQVRWNVERALDPVLLENVAQEPTVRRPATPQPANYVTDV